MRLRNTVAAVACALAAAFSFPGSAHAADGTFSYSFIGWEGPMTSVLTDPPSGTCLILPEVAGPYAMGSAFAPRNDTGAAATVFTGAHCDGDSFVLRPHGGHASERLKLRSVSFS